MRAENQMLAGEADVENFGNGYGHSHRQEMGHTALSRGAQAEQVIAGGQRHGAQFAVGDAQAGEFIGIFCKVHGAGEFHLKTLVEGEGSGVSIEGLGTAGDSEGHMGGSIAAGITELRERDLGEGSKGEGGDTDGKERAGGLGQHVVAIFATFNAMFQLFSEPLLFFLPWL